MIREFSKQEVLFVHTYVRAYINIERGDSGVNPSVRRRSYVLIKGIDVKSGKASDITNEPWWSHFNCYATYLLRLCAADNCAPFPFPLFLVVAVAQRPTHFSIFDSLIARGTNTSTFFGMRIFFCTRSPPPITDSYCYRSKVEDRRRRKNKSFEDYI